MNLLINRYSVPGVCFLIAFCLAIFEPSVESVLSYQRSLILNGELWRLISGNFLHTNWFHFALNSGGLFLIWLIFWDVTNRWWQSLFLMVPIVINTLLLLVFSPDLEGYVGLSGALHGTIVAFGIADFSKNKWTSIGLLLGVTIKLAYEQISGSSESLESLIEAAVAVDAHLWGAISGVFIGLIYCIFNHDPSSNTNPLRDSPDRN